MNDFGKNLVGGLLGAFYLMCFAFPIGLLFDVFRDHMPIGQFLFNQLITFLAVWFVGYFFVQMYRELLANANKPRDHNEEGQNNRQPDDAPKNIDHTQDGQDANKPGNDKQ